METNLENQSVNEIMPEPKRPQFLTVLCILTWICSALILLSTINNIVNKPSPEEMAEAIEKMQSVSPAAAEKMEAAMESMDSNGQMISNLISLVAVFISAMGAMMMWQLKRKGFFVYIAGELLPYVGFITAGGAAFGTMSAMTGMSEAAMMGTIILVMLLFDGLFIGMYAANLKHMKN